LSADVIVIGAGGHARVIADTLRAMHNRVLGFTDVDARRHGETIDGIPVLGGDEVLGAYSNESTYLANGVGSIGIPTRRREIHGRLTAAGWRFFAVVHPGATVSPLAGIEAGAQVMAGAVVQPGVIVGCNSIINTGALVDHECVLGAHSHIAPGAVLSGNVTLGECCHVGTGAVIIQGVVLGPNTVVGAGAVVVRSHPGGSTLIGVPAREKNEP